MTAHEAPDAAAAVATTAPSTPHVVRDYTPDDYSQICDICKDVYGGTDFVPRVLPELAQRPAVLILVAEAAASDGAPLAPPRPGSQQPGPVDGIICCENRGGCWFLFGLRVRSDVRGRGLGTLLVRAAQHSSQARGACSRLLTSTIPANTSARSIFAKSGLQLSASVDIWPPWSLVNKYEQAIGWPGTQAGPGTPHMLAAVLGDRWAELMTEAAAEVKAVDGSGSRGVASWRRCDSSEQLRAAMVQLAAAAAAAAQGRREQPPQDWFPFAYEAFGLDSEWVAGQLEDGNVWLLEDGQPQPQQQEQQQLEDAATAAALAATAAGRPTRVRAAMLMTFHPPIRRVSAGIVAADEGAVHACITRAAQLAPHFSLYIQRVYEAAGSVALEANGRRTESMAPQSDGPAVGPDSSTVVVGLLPALYAATGGCDTFLVYAASPLLGSGCRGSPGR